MKIKSEASPLTREDGAVYKAMAFGVWGIRLSFEGEDNSNRYEIILNLEQAQDFISQIRKSLDAVEKCKNEIVDGK